MTHIFFRLVFFKLYGFVKFRVSEGKFKFLKSVNFLITFVICKKNVQKDIGFASFHCFLILYFPVCKGVFIVAANRTPFAKYGGKLKDFSSLDLQKIAINGAFERNHVKRDWVSYVCVGNTEQVIFFIIGLIYSYKF